MTTTTTAAPSTRSELGTGRTILIADKFEAAGAEALAAHGCRVEVHPDLGPDTLPGAIAEINPHILVVRSTKVPAPVIEAAPRLSLIVRAGAGYDNIDVETASRSGVFVANCPGKNALAVAELAWGLIISCDRRIPDQTIALREGRWDKKGFAKNARGLSGRTLGIVGLGTIGRAIADRGRAFGMRVIAWSRSLTPELAEEYGIEAAASPGEVAQYADVVSVSVASTAETRHLVDEAFCAALKPGAIFVNTSRGAVVDEAALTQAIRTKGIRAGLDVYDGQPTPADTIFSNPIAGETGVYGTHHCGASTEQAQEAIADETVRIIERHLATGEVPNCVNRAASTPATCGLTVRHHNQPGVLAHVFNVLSEAGLNVEEMENIICEGAHAACARIRLDDSPTADAIAAISENHNVLSVDLT